MKKATLKGGDALPWERVVNVGEEKFLKSSNFKRSFSFFGWYPKEISKCEISNVNNNIIPICYKVGNI